MRGWRSENSGDEAPLGALVIGGGPAGLAVLLAARRSGRLVELLDAGVMVIEKHDVVGPGEIGRYAIRSDSLADSFLGPLATDAAPPLQHLLRRGAGEQLDGLRGRAVDLTLVADFLADLGFEFRRSLTDGGVDPFLTGVEALCSQRRRDGAWVTQCRLADGGVRLFCSRVLVLATGADQPIRRLSQAKVAGLPLLPRFSCKTIQSGELLGHAGAQMLAQALGRETSPKVVIVGASHSAIASAHTCLFHSGGVRFGARSVTVLHREEFRLTYGSAAQALEDGYVAFGPADLCSKTGRVFPLAGLRSESRDLMRRAFGLGGSTPDPRLQLIKLEEERFEEANRILEEADLIVAALGYRPRALPLFDRNGERFSLLADFEGPLVDARSRVLDAVRRPVPSVFAMGLAAGYPLANIHGEASFTGQANGLALWQSDIGEELVSQLLDQISEFEQMRESI